MKCVLTLLVALCLGACAQAPKATPFTPPDGHWWLGASADERDGFDIGYVECNAFIHHRPVEDTTRDAVEHAITAYYQGHPAQMKLPVTEVIARVDAQWGRDRTHAFVSVDPKDEYDGDMWWEAVNGQRDGIIRGFLACQKQAGARLPVVSVSTLIERVSAWYGMMPYENEATDEKRVDARHRDKLGAVILGAERERR